MTELYPHNMKYIDPTPAGNWKVRIYIIELGYQVYFGTYADLDEAKRVRDLEDIRYKK